jgi:hypothetical protein
LVRVNCGAFTGVVTAPTHRLGKLPIGVPVAHPGSPPPVAPAVFVALIPFSAFVGVTGITKLTGVLIASPVFTVHAMPCPPVLTHPPGSVPIVNPPGIVSAIVVTSVVAAVPVFVTVSVYVAAWFTTNVVGVALLLRLSCGDCTVPVTVPLQCNATGQLASPVSLPAVAVLLCALPPELLLGVTGIV